jgi:alginate O-acetyltransferase complex protein AlgI
MLFNSATFLVFFVCFGCFYLATRRRLRAQNIVLLVASYIFYGWWDERFLVLVIVSTANDFIGGIGASGQRPTRKDVGKAIGVAIPVIVALTAPDLARSWPALVGGLAFCALAPIAVYLLERIHGEARRKAYMIASITVNLSILGFFKYANFFSTSLAGALRTFGIEADTVLLDIVLPVGISFYTFQTMSYTIDIYRRQMEPTRSLLDFAAYVSFFPQLVAGPIERAGHLLPQFQRLRHLSADRASEGAALFLWGLYKKMVIADNVAVIANHMFGAPAGATAGQAITGVIAFTIQIYCDFSGYSDMARGLARMLGFDLMVNFNLPYFSRTPSEFWRRWHISLSSWLRDYLYVSLGGNRHGRWKTYRNLMLTMLLGGLWHGASWTFVAWGALHGSILCVYRALRIDDQLTAADPRRWSGMMCHGLAWLVMMTLVMCGWTLFRARSFEDAMSVFQAALSFRHLASDNWSILGFYIAPLAIVELAQRVGRRVDVSTFGPHFIRVNAALFCIYSLLFLSAAEGQEFIYFDF